MRFACQNKLLPLRHTCRMQGQWGLIEKATVNELQGYTIEVSLKNNKQCVSHASSITVPIAYRGAEGNRAWWAGSINSWSQEHRHQHKFQLVCASLEKDFGSVAVLRKHMGRGAVEKGRARRGGEGRAGHCGQKEMEGLIAT